MDEKFKGIIIKTTEINDADKLASIFSLEHGVVTAKFIGVKKDKAKFKSVAQPFVLADFCVSKNGNTRTVTGADIVNGFTQILTDYNKMMCGYIVLDILKSILPSEKTEPKIFALTVNTLSEFEQTNPFVVAIDFILKFLFLNGVELQFVEAKYIYLDTITGNFQLERTPSCLQIDKNVYDCLKNINDSVEIEAIEVNEKTAKQVLHLLHNIIYIKFGEDIKCFQYI